MTADAATTASLWRAWFGRHAAVWRTAWALRHELAGPRRLADEAAFLPAALSLQETPPHPAPRRAAWAIVALFVVALTWACVGELDIVAVAPGRIVVSDRSKTIQPLEPAVVKAIHVRDGDRVREGQVLVELDATADAADAESLRAQRAAARSEAERSATLLAALQTGASPRPLADAAAQALQNSEWADLSARRARADAEVARREAELATASAAAEKLHATLPIARQREADVRALSEQGFMAQHAGQDRMRDRIEIERDLATQQARVREAQAMLAESRQARTALQAEAHRQLADRRAQAELKLAHLTQESAKSEHRQRRTQLTAPVSGTVQQLAVHTLGGVVTAAQPLLVVVPDDAEVIAEVTIENKDIGFVRVGQTAEIKLDAFPFTRYGTVKAEVKTIAADAVVDEKRGAVYPAVFRLMNWREFSSHIALKPSPGMTLAAEVRIGNRKVAEYLFSPLLGAASEAMKEQ